VEPGTSPDSRPSLALTGPLAHEALFKHQAPGKSLLHLATHGFFLRGDCGSSDNPLLLSGLALSGANNRDDADSNQEDGILTAEEIASLDLSSVEWAVLSACETGSGEIVDGEGVFGLRRAFEIAGADTLIMTLWSVQDDAARAWVRELYAARRERGESTADSVRDASVTILSERREAGQSTHPFYWGAFVAVGDWR
jgi:CHAT domain-containing protein